MYKYFFMFFGTSAIIYAELLKKVLLMPDVIWENLTSEEKKAELYRKQKELLDMFLERNAISKAQYDKSLGDLTEKMGMSDKFKFVIALEFAIRACGRKVGL